MRASTPVLLGLCAIAFACTVRPTTDAGAGGPQTAQNTIGSDPGGDPCAAYIERTAPGVRCTAIDATHCSCELVAGSTPAETPAGNSGGNGTGGGGAATPPAAEAAVANLEFAKGPPNTIVQCVSGPCPTRSADFITGTYPPIPIPAGGATIQLEFRAQHYKPYVGTYNLVPGRNFIQFSFEREFGAPTTASFQFDGSPAGATVQCVSGPCADTKTYPIDKFPAIPLNEDGGTLLLRFNAPGYRTAMTSFQVHRGANVVPVLMEKAPLKQ